MRKALANLPDDAPLFVSGYEDGLDDANGLERVLAVALHRNTAWYYGAHEELYEDRVEKLSEAERASLVSGWVIGSNRRVG